MPTVVQGPKVWWMPVNDRPSHAKAAVGARLRVLRSVLGIPQNVMAQTLHISAQALSGWERGRDLADPLVMARAALRYGFTTDWIFIGRLAHMPGSLATELERRRPDLVLGADPGAVPSDDWDTLTSTNLAAG